MFLGLGGSRASDAARLAKIKKQIHQLAANLKMSISQAEQALRLYKLAKDRANFVKGRPTTHVIAACLYIVCRMKKTPHLLIDISDAVQVIIDIKIPKIMLPLLFNIPTNNSYLSKGLCTKIFH